MLIGVDKNGNALGEAHHRARLSDADVELIRGMYDEGFVSYGTLAKVFGVKKTTIRDIILFRRRATPPARYKKIEIERYKPIPLDRLAQLTKARRD